MSADIIDCAYQIHTQLGPGLLESVYEVLLEKKLTDRGHHVERQKAITCVIDGITFNETFRADLIVDGCVVLEIKAAVKIAYVFERQLLTYMKLLDHRLGLLLNFGMPTMKRGYAGS
jgi:iron complex transport system substrate-binding protein